MLLDKVSRLENNDQILQKTYNLTDPGERSGNVLAACLRTLSHVLVLILCSARSNFLKQ
jgi:hypothetical protein